MVAGRIGEPIRYEDVPTYPSTVGHWYHGALPDCCLALLVRDTASPKVPMLSALRLLSKPVYLIHQIPEPLTFS
jgi:hypothetical protein